MTDVLPVAWQHANFFSFHTRGDVDRGSSRSRMQEALLNILACPRCRVRLELAAGAETDGPGRIRSGVLHCTACGAAYPVMRGVPRLLPQPDNDTTGPPTDEQRTSAHFTNEFTALAQADKDLT